MTDDDRVRHIALLKERLAMILAAHKSAEHELHALEDQEEKIRSKLNRLDPKPVGCITQAFLDEQKRIYAQLMSRSESRLGEVLGKADADKEKRSS